jgi:hypothetical protein
MALSRHALSSTLRASVGTLILLFRPISLPGQGVQHSSNMKILAHLELDKSMYSVKETPRLRISLINTSAGRVSFVPMGASDMVHLVVKRAGKLVEQNTSEAGTGGIQVPGAQLRPGVALALDSGRWLPLSDFGYKLQEPGQYTIQGVPQIGNQSEGVDTQSARGNAVTFTITLQNTDAVRGKLP